jgi:hypothetical protein
VETGGGEVARRGETGLRGGGVKKLQVLVEVASAILREWG